MNWDKFCAELARCSDEIGSEANTLTPDGRRVVRTIQGVLLGIREAVLAGAGKKDNAAH